MIKLTLHQSTDSQTFIFTKECIVIGEGQPENIDISLKGLGLHQNHIKIFTKRNYYYISNQANDPFITLNGLPFGKKKLKPQDSIQIKDYKITVEELHVEITKETEASASEVAITELQNLEEQICDFPNAEKLSQEDDLEGWFPSDLSELNIEDIAKIDEHKQSNSKASGDEVCGINEHQSERKGNAKSSFFSLRSLKWVATFSFLFFLVASAIGVESYLRAASKSGIEEQKAAESLADIAMALVYAKVFHIIPQNHNYSDPEFLKNNLTALLPSTAVANGTIDTKGLFSNCSYLFRFYSDQSLSRFLIIAQPAPSISQWLFPKDAILIDSALMDLRKITDLKTINGLLAAAKPFEGINGRELSDAIKHLKVLSLPHLAKNAKKMEFAPPKILKYIRPGSENLIYNAPRYFLFAEPLVKKLLAYDLNNQNDQSALESEIERFSAFDNLILYSSDGLQAANKINKGLFSAKKAASFLSGYLLLSATDEILSSRLIIDTQETIPNPTTKVESTEIAEADKALSLPFTSPLNKKFENFRNTTQEALRPLLKQMAEILEGTLQKNETELRSEFFIALENYQQTKEIQKKKLSSFIQKMEQKHPNLTSIEIFQYLKRYQLEHLLEDWERKSKLQIGFLINAPFQQNSQSTLPPFKQ